MEGRDRPSRRWPWIVAAIVAVAAIGAATWFVIAQQDDGQEVAVRLEPATGPGPGAFTSSFSTVDDGVVADFSTAGADDGSGSSGFTLTRVDGGRAGLYGTVSGVDACDRDGLSAALVGDEGVASAWAGALGIDVASIDAVVHGLAPVVLGRDTAVTNHRYRGGRAEPFQAVLQAGTAVLVDANGIPRVRCACGNPLDEPEIEGRRVVVEGERWPEFSEAAISRVRPSEIVLTMVATVDVGSGETVDVPVQDVMPDAPADATVPSDASDTSDGSTSTSTAEPSSTTTTSEAPLPPIDPFNMRLPEGVCPVWANSGTQDHIRPSVEIIDGQGEHGVRDDGYVIIWVHEDPAHSDRGDIDGDGVEDLALTVTCNWGGSGRLTPVLVLRPTSSGDPELVGNVIDLGLDPAREAGEVSIDGDVLVVSGGELRPGDNVCCPSGTFTSRYELQGDTWVEIA